MYSEVLYLDRFTYEALSKEDEKFAEMVQSEAVKQEEMVGKCQRATAKEKLIGRAHKSLKKIQALAKFGSSKKHMFKPKRASMEGGSPSGSDGADGAGSMVSWGAVVRKSSVIADSVLEMFKQPDPAKVHPSPTAPGTPTTPTSEKSVGEAPVTSPVADQG